MIRGMIAGLLSGVVVSAGILALISLALPPPSAPPLATMPAPAEVVVAAPPPAPGPVIAPPSAADLARLVGSGPGRAPDGAPAMVSGAAVAVVPGAVTDDRAPPTVGPIVTETADNDAAGGDAMADRVPDGGALAAGDGGTGAPAAADETALATPDTGGDDSAATARDTAGGEALVQPGSAGADMSRPPAEGSPAPRVGATPAGLVRLDTAAPGPVAPVAGDLAGDGPAVPPLPVGAADPLPEAPATAVAGLPPAPLIADAVAPRPKPVIDAATPLADALADVPARSAPPSPAATPARPAAGPLVADAPPPAALPPAALPPSPDRGGADDPADPVARALPGRPAGRLTDRRPTPGRLPVIGAPPPTTADAAVGGAVGTAPPATTPAAPPDDAATATDDAAITLALRRHARPFANPEGRPLFTILLLDDGRAPLSPADLPADLPVTLIVDPATPAAAERAAAWAAAGQEVAVLASVLPRSANAADVEIALESLAATLPPVLALVDPVGNALPGDRRHLAAALPALAERGLGLVTGGRGRSNAAGMAGPAGVPATGIFRELDREDETAPVIRRYLDRAAFKAQQDGQVVMLGRLRPATLAAIDAWATDPRTTTAVAPAPLSAVLSGAGP